MMPLQSLPKIRRQRVFQAFSVPGANKLQKLMSSLVAFRVIFTAKTARNLTTTSKGQTHRKKLRNSFSLGVRATFLVVTSETSHKPRCPRHLIELRENGSDPKSNKTEHNNTQQTDNNQQTNKHNE